MTYFLAQEPVIPRPQVGPAAGESVGVPNFIEGTIAAFNVAQVENDSNFLINRTTRRISSDRARTAIDRLDQNEIARRIEEAGIYTGDMSPHEAIGANPKVTSLVLEMAREAASASPDDWKDLDLSDEAITAEVNAYLRAEWEEGQAILNMMPRGHVAAGLLGGMAGITADVKNVPFLLLGGPSGSILRTMGREAFINMAAEAAFLPAQFEMAERLDIPDPNVVTQLALAAGAGAVLGAGFEGAARGLYYWRNRSRPTVIPGYTVEETENLLTQIEEALHSDDPFAAVDAIMRSAQADPPEPPAGRPPLILRPEDRATTEPMRTEAAEGPPRSAPDSPATRFEPDPNRPQFPDTRGLGARFHGARGPISELVSEFYDGGEGNIYGGGFYTSDAVAITSGYRRGQESGVVYRVDEVGSVTPFDMEQPVPDWLAAEVRKIDGMTGDMLNEALEERPENVREFYDILRSLSSSYQLPTYEMQEIFDEILRPMFQARGFNAFDHVGGLRTQKAPHAVRIYFDPASQVRITQIDPANPDIPTSPSAPDSPATTPDIETTLLPPSGAPQVGRMDQGTIEAIESAIAEAEQDLTQAETTAKNLIRMLRRNHLEPNPRGEARPSYQIHPDGPVAEILRANDITSRTHPGLYSRKGIKDVDNFVAVEMEDMFPGIIEATGTSRGDTYLDRQGFIDVIVDTATGRNYSWLRDYSEARARLAGFQRDLEGSPTDDFLAGEQSPIENGLFINRDAYLFDTDEFTAMARIADDVERYLSDIEGLTPQERREIVYAAQQNGGDVDYLVERAFEREAEYVRGPEEAADEVPFDAPAPRDAGGDGQPAPVPEEAGLGGTSVSRDAGDAGASGRPTGQQGVIPGTERQQTGQAQADRLYIAARQQQSRIGRLDQERVEDDMGGLFGGRQSDMFDDVTSPEAKVIHDSIMADLRDGIDAEDGLGDFTVDMGDGKGERPVSSVLDEIRQGEEFAEIIALCGRRE